MTIDEMIEALLEIKEEHGDLPVYRTYRDEAGGGEEEMDESCFDVREPSAVAAWPLRLTVMDW